MWACKCLFKASFFFANDIFGDLINDCHILHHCHAYNWVLLLSVVKAISHQELMGAYELRVNLITI